MTAHSKQDAARRGCSGCRDWGACKLGRRWVGVARRPATGLLTLSRRPFLRACTCTHKPPIQPSTAHRPTHPPVPPPPSAQMLASAKAASLRTWNGLSFSRRIRVCEGRQTAARDERECSTLWPCRGAHAAPLGCAEACRQAAAGSQCNGPSTSMPAAVNRSPAPRPRPSTPQSRRALGCPPHCSAPSMPRAAARGGGSVEVEGQENVFKTLSTLDNDLF